MNKKRSRKRRQQFINEKCKSPHSCLRASRVSSARTNTCFVANLCNRPIKERQIFMRGSKRASAREMKYPGNEVFNLQTLPPQFFGPRRRPGVEFESMSFGLRGRQTNLEKTKCARDGTPTKTHSNTMWLVSRDSLSLSLPPSRIFRAIISAFLHSLPGPPSDAELGARERSFSGSLPRGHRYTMKMRISPPLLSFCTLLLPIYSSIPSHLPLFSFTLFFSLYFTQLCERVFGVHAPEDSWAVLNYKIHELSKSGLEDE